MCVEQLEENNNIINIDTIEVSKLIEFSIYYLLNVDKQIFESYSNNIKIFLVLINNKEKLIFIFKRNQELQEES
jgi:hypothetical protein